MPGRKRQAAATSLLVESQRRRSRRASGAVTTRSCSWLDAWPLAFTAERRAVLRALIISTRPSALLGVPAVSPASTVRAAASASMGSDLPLRLR